VHVLIRHFFAIFLHLGALGLVILGVLDSSFLFLPVGNDLLLIALIAGHHGEFLFYVLAASLGSVAGVLLLDLVCRKGGEEGLKLIIACLAPPPFPFTAIVAAASALQYPRLRLLGVVFGARAVRFSLVGLGAIWLNRSWKDLQRCASLEASRRSSAGFASVVPNRAGAQLHNKADAPPELRTGVLLRLFCAARAFPATPCIWYSPRPLIKCFSRVNQRRSNRSASMRSPPQSQ
jgi:membrane protein YqaA with SNARE-associated domain